MSLSELSTTQCKIEIPYLNLEKGEMIFQARKKHLVRISINDRLLLKFYFTRVVTISLYMHCPIMIAIELSQDKVVDGCCYLMYKVQPLRRHFTKRKMLPNAGSLPCSTGILLHHQTPRKEHQQDQAELNDPKIYSLDCCLPKISNHAPHNGMQQL